MFSAVTSEHFSKNRMIISVVAAKIWYLKNVLFLLGHPVCVYTCVQTWCTVILIVTTLTQSTWNVLILLGVALVQTALPGTTRYELSHSLPDV